MDEGRPLRWDDGRQKTEDRRQKVRRLESEILNLPEQSDTFNHQSTIIYQQSESSSLVLAKRSSLFRAKRSSIAHLSSVVRHPSSIVLAKRSSLVPAHRPSLFRAKRSSIAHLSSVVRHLFLFVHRPSEAVFPLPSEAVVPRPSASACLGEAQRAKTGRPANVLPVCAPDDRERHR